MIRSWCTVLLALLLGAGAVTAAAGTAVRLAATKVVSGTFVPGGTVTYTIVLTNSGGAAQSDNPGNEFIDVMPTRLTLVSANATSGTAIASVGSNTVTWNGAIPPGGSVTITIASTINADALGVVGNIGAIAYDADANGTNETTALTDDPSVAGSDDSTGFAIAAAPIVAGTMTVAGDFAPGGTVVYTAVLTNSGNGFQLDNFGSEFRNLLLTGLTLVSASASSGTAIADIGTNTAIWNGAIAPSGSVTITITAVISPTATGMIRNQGLFTFDSNGNRTNDAVRFTDDPTVPGATDPTVFAVVPQPIVSGTKAVGGSFVAGGTVMYTIVLNNTGGGAQPDNPGNEFTDVLPGGLALVSATASAGTATTTVATRTVTWNGSIPAAGAVLITITATIDPAATGTIINQGTIAFDADANGTNEAAAVTDDPDVAGTGDATRFGVAAPPLQVPAIDAAALLLLAALMLAAARARRRA